MQLETIGQLLAKHAFFQGLEQRDLELIAGCAKNVRFEAGQYIAREGSPADVFYVIRFGKVALEITAPGRGPVIIQTLGEHDVLGWSWLVPPYRWKFDARAVELTRAVQIDGECLRKKCDEDPRLGYTLLKRLTAIFVERLQATRLQLLDLYGNHR